MFKHDYFGAGPKIGRPGIALMLVAVGLSFWKPEYFRVTYPFNEWVELAGYLMLGFGAFWNASTIIRMKQAVQEGKLLTDRTFAACRHPNYLGWTVGVIPAVALITGAWLVWFSPFIMYFCFTKFIHEEEEMLAETFGDEWDAYVARTPQFWPRF